MPVVVLPDHDTVARVVAQRIAELIRRRHHEGRRPVLGLATGSTPVGVYRELIRMHREEGLDFSDVVTFNLDEYYPMRPDSIHSYHRFMWENFLQHVNVKEENVHIPRGDIPRAEVGEFSRRYEEAISRAGGIDFQILGIGRTGHIGFNEPGSGKESRTRLLYLDTITRKDAAADFFGEDNVPSEAVTMGVATILEAREIALLATGEHKALIIKRAVEGEIHPDVAATFLQEHPNATIYLDPSAAGELTRFKTPWLVGAVEWTPELEMEAVLWLSQQVGKAILHLSNEDYRDHHLSSLVARHGAAGPLNGEIFNGLISKVQGKSKLPKSKRIVVFSPHPDDDVISMGGILRKLHENANAITVAYQTSGNIAVFDHEVRRYLDFLRRADPVMNVCTDDVVAASRRVEEAMAAKQPGDVDIPEVQNLKRVIRETEAVSGIETFGMKAEQARFLDLPFYQTGKVKKDPITEADVDIVLKLLDEVQPEIVFAAGDLSDPHGTHRMCLEAVMRALARYRGPEPELWLYRGAWQEWPVNEADVLVPMSEDELRVKKMAIFKHQSQKDRAPFPGPDEREFWQRVEDRNRGTAARLASLGLPAYYAMEAYVVRRRGQPLVQPMLTTSDLARPPRYRRASDFPAFAAGAEEGGP
jgi:glucosamine-6-phosphate deaminase